MGDGVRLSVVVPCFNEAASIGGLYDSVRTALAEMPDVVFDFVFVDDGSDDETLACLRALADRDPAVHYIAFSRNFGKEAAMLAGLERADGDAVIVMDADLQHPAWLLPQLINRHLEGFDQVIARRDRRGDEALRRFATRVFYRLINRLVDVRLLDGAGDFRLLSRSAVNAVLAMPEYNRFSKGLFSWIGFNTAVIAYQNEARQSGRSAWTFNKLFNYAIDGLLSFNSRPLRLAIHAGLLLALVSFIYLVSVVVNVAIRGIDVPGYTTIMIGVIGLGGVQMTILGIIGEYIGRIYYETKRRPHYLVRETEESPGVTPPRPAPRPRNGAVRQFRAE
ncbi:MAG TPA: glycosyltransferase family 2 protein [Actinoplanes sp.]|nr:glycosyltransferase family 2 protein [Actinoplanes sp.]